MKHIVSLCEDGITLFLTYIMILLSLPFIITPYNQDCFFKHEKSQADPSANKTLRITI